MTNTMRTHSSKPLVVMLCNDSGRRFRESIGEEIREHKLPVSEGELRDMLDKELGGLMEKPKLMVPIGPIPVLVHSMRSFTWQQHSNFMFLTTEPNAPLQQYLSTGEFAGTGKEFINQEAGKPTLDVLMGIKDRLGGHCIIAMPDVLSDTDANQLMRVHVAQGNDVTAAVLGDKAVTFAGVAALKTSSLTPELIEGIERGAAGHESSVVQSPNSSLLKLLRSGRTARCQCASHAQRMSNAEDLINLRLMWVRGDAFWPGAYSSLPSKPDGPDQFPLRLSPHDLMAKLGDDARRLGVPYEYKNLRRTTQ
ncbi:MAG: hypothetical protein ABIH11_05005 [Candidatus Altiarchaeota archaeon]